MRSSPASLSPWHVFPPRRRCRCFLLRFQSFIPSPVVCPSAHFNINYRVVDGYVYVQESDTVRRRWREEAADLVSERRGQAFGGRSIVRRETLRAAAAAAAMLGLRLLSSQGDSHSSRRDMCHFVFAPALRRPRQKRDIIAAEIGSIFRRKRSPPPLAFH